MQCPFAISLLAKWNQNSIVDYQDFKMAPNKKGKELPQNIKERVVRLHKEKVGYKTIAKTLLISKNTVVKVVQRYKKRGTVVSKERSGRPKKLSERAVRLVTNIALKDRRQAAPTLAEVATEVQGTKVSEATIRRVLHRAQLHGRRPRRKPLLKPRHKQMRLKFANEHRNKPSKFWDSILWSDETKINLFGSDGVQHVWRRVGEDYKDACVVPTVKHGGGSLMLWGCMSSLGVGELHFIDGIMNSEQYCAILGEKMLPSLKRLGRGACFQHDNDPKHASKKTSEFLKKKKVKVLTWPSMSPDLNPIEHLWNVLKRNISKHQPSNLRELKDIVNQEWSNISKAICQDLVHSMPNRVKSVLANNGSHTKY